MEPHLIIFITLMIIFLAGMTQGLAGFGFSLVSVPTLIIFYDSQLLIPILVIHSTVINMMLFMNYRRCVQIRRIWPLMLSGAIGIPFGTYLLIIIEHQTLKLIVGILIMIIGLAYLRNFRKKVNSEKAACVPIGFISGILNGSISISGPPVIFFFTNQGIRKKIFRANLFAFFLFINLVTLPVFFVSGLFTCEVFELSLMLLPAMRSRPVLPTLWPITESGG